MSEHTVTKELKGISTENIKVLKEAVMPSMDGVGSGRYMHESAHAQGSKGLRPGRWWTSKNFCSRRIGSPK
jgi:hypothetical protein